LYIPQNYDRSFKGWVSVRTALGASLNVPAVRALVMVSPDAFAKQLRALGLPLKNEGDFYGYSLALGSADISLMSLTNAYRSLANGGKFSNTRFQAQAAPSLTAAPIQALTPQASFIVSDILSDTNARARTFGTDSVLTTRFWTAVKTGTSKDMRDNWAIGYSQRYTVGVWVGNADGSSMWDVSGTSGAAPVWASIMSHLHRHTPSRAPAPPAGLERQQVQLLSADAAPTASAASAPMLEAPRQEWFITGTAQTQFALRSPHASSAQAGHHRDTTKSIAKNVDYIPTNGLKILQNTSPDLKTASSISITSPAPGSVIALDPDIPPRHQRLHFTAQNTSQINSPMQWLLNGKPISKTAHHQWLPLPGRHTLQLTDAQGRVLDEVKFEVRGAAMKVAGR
jgi:penicillin-binding protein 1C